MPKHWLMKSEPDTFGIADLARVKIEPWSGVRSFFARQHMRAMAVGDRVLFHHSSVTPPGVAGLARVVRVGVVDETQFDPAGKYYEPKATREAPVWDCVDVEYVETFPHFVTMDRMRAEPALGDMMVLRRGMRLSVQPATEAEYETIVRLGHTEPPPEQPKPKAKAKSKMKVKVKVKAKARPTTKQRPKAKPNKRAATKATTTRRRT